MKEDKKNTKTSIWDKLDSADIVIIAMFIMLAIVEVAEHVVELFK